MIGAALSQLTERRRSGAGVRASEGSKVQATFNDPVLVVGTAFGCFFGFSASSTTSGSSKVAWAKDYDMASRQTRNSNGGRGPRQQQQVARAPAAGTAFGCFFPPTLISLVSAVPFLQDRYSGPVGPYPPGFALI